MQVLSINNDAFIKSLVLGLALILFFRRRLSFKSFIPVFVLLTVAFFSEYLTMDKMYLYSDMKRISYPFKEFYVSQIKNFRLPLWYPYNGCGFSFIGESQAGIFYPLNLLLFSIFPVIPAFNYSIIIHFILAGIFTYAYARQMKLDGIQSALCALIFTFNGAFLTQLVHFNIMTINAWIPLIFYLIELGFSRHFFYWFIMSFVMAVQFLAGHPQTVIFSLIGAGLYFLVRLIFTYNKSIIRRMFLFTAAIIFALLLASIQILPTLELKPYSSRAAGFGRMFFDYSLHPKFFINIIYPFFYGVDNWGTYFGSWNFIGLCLYVGPVVLFLGLLTFLKREKTVYVRNLIFFCILFLILMMGEYGILYKFFYCLPFFRGFRCPYRFKYLLLFWLAISAAIGLGQFYQLLQQPQKKKTLRIYLHSALALAAILAILIWQKTIMVAMTAKLFTRWPGLLITYFNHRYTPEELGLILANIDIKAQEFLNTITARGYIYFYLAGIIIFCLLALIELHKPQGLGQSAFNKSVILIVFFDLMIFKTYYLQAPIRLPEGNKIVEKLLQDNSLFRIYDRDLLIANYNSRYKISNICQYSGLPVAKTEALLDKVRLENSHLSGVEVLDLLNVKYIISKASLDNKNLLLVETDNNLNLYKNKSMLDRCFFIKGIKEIEKNGIFAYYNKGNLNLDIKELTGKIKILSIDYTPNEIVIKTDNEVDAFLLISDLYYPGWKALIDDKQVEMKNIDQLFRAVFVRKGVSFVKFIYQPRSVKIGAYISMVSFILLSLILISGYKFKMDL